MASSVIHLAVANELNKKLNRDNDRLLIGSIAPDISRFLGETKLYSHFLDNVENNIPNIEKFLNKYKEKLNDDFVLGYFIHLYTDYLWFKYFIPEISNGNYVTKLDGTVEKYSKKTLLKYIYNDYTDLNIKLLDEYSLNLDILYNEPPKFDNIIEEIPMEKIQVIIDNTSIIIANSNSEKAYVFNIDNIKVFIKTCIELTLSKLKEIGIE